MARRRSKWRKTTVLMKKLMQEARKARARESLRQCPVCGSPNTLSIDIKEDRWTGIKNAVVRCSACGFEMKLDNLPPIADEFWIYSKVLDAVRGEITAEAQPAEESGAPAEAAEEGGEGKAEIEFVEVSGES